MTPEQQELKALGFEIPDSITPIVACRSWRVDSHTGFLCSHNATRWVPGKVMKAKCRYALRGDAGACYHSELGSANPDEVSKGFNLALVAITYSFGVVAMALGIYTTLLRRSYQKMMRRLYS